MFVLGGLGPPEYEIIDLEDPPPNFSFMVPTESLLVMSEADDSHLTSLLEPVDRILLSLHGSVLVEGLYSWGTVIEVGGHTALAPYARKKGVNPVDRFGVVLRLQRIAGTSATHRPAYFLSRSKMRGLSP